jgi:hypothetical protein
MVPVNSAIPASLARILPLALVVLAAIILVVSGQLYAPPQVIITWETESELDTAGFHLYRGDSPSGPFEPITEELIPASPDPNTGGQYKFEDPDVEAGRTYYYELEDVETSGVATRHGPITVEAHGGWNPYGVGALLLLLVVAVWSVWRTPAPVTSP